MASFIMVRQRIIVSRTSPLGALSDQPHSIRIAYDKLFWM